MFDLEIWQWLLILVLFLTCHWYLSMPSGLPPGPYGLPFLGHLFLGKRPHKTFAQLGKKYGGVLSLYVGKHLLVVLNDYESVKDALVGQGIIFSGRPKELGIDLENENPNSIVTTDGKYWREHRLFALTTLRDSGLGKSVLEMKILNEIQHLLQKLEKLDGCPHDIRNLVGTSVSRNIWGLIFGDSSDFSEERLLSMVNSVRTATEVNGVVSPQRMFPWLKKIPGFKKLIKADVYERIMYSIMDTCRDAINLYRKKYTENSRDTYLNAFLTERKSRLEKNPNDDLFTMEGLIHNTRDLIGAGTDTTTKTILWSILFLLHYPEMQTKMQKEIDDVIGRERLPSTTDRLRTPYTEAFLMEVLRIITIAPFGVPHRNTKETTIFGHKIPKDATILTNLWGVHHDPKLWGDPEVFRPERFLSQDGTTCLKPEYLIPFSLGKRQCLGESLARAEMYLYLTSMLQHFTFVQPDRVPLTTLEPTTGFLLSTHPFTTRVISRNE